MRNISDQIIKKSGYIMLGTNLSHKGWDYTQIDRKGDVAIYSQSKNGNIKAYEVIKVKKHDGYTIKDKDGQDNFIEPSEFYPKDEAWGDDGFTLMSLNEAKQKMEILLCD